MVFIVYMIVLGIINVFDSNVHFSGIDSDIKVFTFQVSTLCGVFALSFFIHSLIMPIMKNNKNHKENKRDLSIGYAMTAFVYAAVGIFGSLAIAGVPGLVPTPQTVFDYITPGVINAIIELMMFVQLMSVLPIIWYVTRS